MSGSTENPTILLFGNPGVGKSTIISTILGTPGAAESGPSFDGSGVTSKMKEYIVPSGNKFEGHRIVDVPGLDDVKKAKEAAAEITKALKLNKNYIVVFVATLEAGRVRASDSATINAVLGAVDERKFPYSVCINKVGAQVGANSDKKLIEDCINVGVHKKVHLVTMLKVEYEKMESKNSVLGEANKKMLDLLIENSKSVFIPSTSVNDVVPPDSKAISKLNEQIQKLINDQNQMRADHLNQMTELAKSSFSNLGFFGHLGAAVDSLFPK